MATLLGSSYQITRGNSIDYCSYLIKRIKRLLVPTWSFLLIFFCAMFVGSFLLNKEFYSLSMIIRTFTMLDGVGYVWIVRIFFTVAVISPLLNALYERFSISHQRFLILIIGLSIQYVICKFGPIGNVFYRELICNTFGYVILAFVRMMIMEQSVKMNLCVVMLGALQFIFFGVQNKFELLQLNKYPPNLYFLGYGVMISIGLFVI